MKIGNRNVGLGYPCYVVAEMSANHGGSLANAQATIRAMKDAGADAVKIQTYTADTLTIRCDSAPFVVGGGTLWDGRTLFDLYSEASLPWEWQPILQEEALSLGMDFFSTPFDASSVDFLEALNVPVHKVASFELVDFPLLRKIAATGKPVIMSTGMATEEEISEAIAVLRESGSGEVAILKCTSAYPAQPADMNLETIPDMRKRFAVEVGLSDHTMGHSVALVAVTLGACVIEKHFTLSRGIGGPDADFSMEPEEFRSMVDAIRVAEAARGRVNYAVSPDEAKNRIFRRSLFVVADMEAGEPFTMTNVRSIRPGHGLHPRHLETVLGGTARTRIRLGTPLSWDLFQPL